MSRRTGIRITGNDEIARNFRNLSAAAVDIEPIWPSVGLYLSRQVSRQFRTDGAYLSRRKWKRLDPSTIADKRRQGFPAPRPLVRTGALRRSFTSRPMDIEIYNGNSARFGSAKKTALWQQKGTMRGGKRHIPPRPILVATRKVRADVKDIIHKDLMRKGRVLR